MGISNQMYFQKLHKAELQERLDVALEQLPADPEIQKAAAAFSYLVQATPWALTDGYFSCIREGKSLMQISGCGDPTGRGHGFNFLKEIKRAAPEEAASKATMLKAGTLTGELWQRSGFAYQQNHADACLGLRNGGAHRMLCSVQCHWHVLQLSAAASLDRLILLHFKLTHLR